MGAGGVSEERSACLRSMHRGEFALVSPASAELAATKKHRLTVGIAYVIIFLSDDCNIRNIIIIIY